MKRKQPTKKQAATGRPVLCRNGHGPMKQHRDLMLGWDYICETCGLRHEGWFDHGERQKTNLG